MAGNTNNHSGRPTLREWIGGQQGSALILTMLILLVLTAIGMVALKDVARTVQQSGVYRVRTQSDTFTEAASEFVSKRAGDNAEGYWNKMETELEGGMRGATVANQDANSDRGAMMMLTQNDGATGDLSVLGSSTTETGLFYEETQGKASFEQAANEDTHDFRVILRDPMDGIPVPGYSSEFCFKKVTIATESTVGQADPEWSRANMVANSQSGGEVLIGPIDCGNT
ncbi:MAG: hypothetical protein ACQEVA_16470 [Myxococcota bacterium]